MAVNEVRRSCADSLNRILNGSASLESEISKYRESEHKEDAQKTYTFLMKGVIERSETVSAILSKVSKTPQTKMDSEVRAVLWLGIFELMFSGT